MGPFTYFRELYVTTAMTTLSHQYLASMIFSEETIKKIMDKNSIPTQEKKSSLDAIQTFNEYETVTDSIYSPKYDNIEARSISIQELNKIELVNIKRKTFSGYMLIVNDPSRIFLGTPEKFGGIGLKLKDMVQKYDVIGGINAGGFLDINGEGFGGVPTECIIQNSKIIYGDADKEYEIIGFNTNNILVLGNYTLKRALEVKIRDAIAFKPYLIIDGEPIIKEGNGGWGIQPRSAIGQRKDGKVLLLVIDGRQLHSIGATLKDVQDIMLEYGAYNAANLDGGSSTVMYYEGKLINSPCSPYGERFLPSAFLIKR